MRFKVSKLTDESDIRLFGLLLTAIYFISYLTRVNYSAVIAEITTSEHIKKSMLSFALTGSAITYATGQLLFGYLGDKTDPKKMVLLGLSVSASVNILLPICGNVTAMVILWSINGIAQACIWPPLVRIMSVMLLQEDYDRVCIWVSWGGSIGTIAVYLGAPLIIKLSGWKTVFLVSAGLAVAMCIIWVINCPSISIAKSEDKSVKYDDDNCKRYDSLFWTLIIAIFAAIMLEGMLREGLTSWMPSFISEKYNLSSNISILAGVLLPLFSIVMYKIVGSIYQKLLHNVCLLAAILFSIGAITALIMAVFIEKTAALSVIMSMITVGMMHGISLLFTAMAPPYFAKYGKISFMSGLLNAATYMGSAISSYGIAAIAENYGWDISIYIIAFVAGIGAVICFGISKRWNLLNYNK